MNSSKNTSKEKCLVCNAEKLEPLFHFYSRFLPKFFHKIAICSECGHIQVYPLFSEEELRKINDLKFGSLYMKRNKQNLAGNEKKLTKLDERLSPYIRKHMNVLDDGAGEAWAMEYFINKKCNYFVIEVVSRLADLINSRGEGSYWQECIRRSI